MDRYLAGEVIDPDTLVADLETAVARGSFFPVIPVNAPSPASAWTRCWTSSTRGFPSPLEHSLPPVTGLEGEPARSAVVRPGRAARRRGRQDDRRRLRGAGVAGAGVLRHAARRTPPVHVSGHGDCACTADHPDHDADERVGATCPRRSARACATVARCVAGDICAITKLDHARRPATRCRHDDPLLVAPWEMPEPLLPIAVVADDPRRRGHARPDLARLVAEDPTLRLERNADTGQLRALVHGRGPRRRGARPAARAAGVDIDARAVRVRAAGDLHRRR